MDNMIYAYPAGGPEEGIIIIGKGMHNDQWAKSRLRYVMVIEEGSIHTNAAFDEQKPRFAEKVFVPEDWFESDSFEYVDEGIEAVIFRYKENG